MDWLNKLTEEEKTRLIEIDKIRDDLTAEHRRIYDRCRRRQRKALNAVEITTPTGHKFIVDQADVELVEQFQWFAVGHTKGGIEFRSPYIQGNVEGRRVFLHRLLLGEPAGLVVDHIDGDPLNNCRSNLRAVTHIENMRAKNHFKPSLGATNGLSM